MYIHRYSVMAIGIVCALSVSASAAMIITGEHNDHPIISGGSLSDVRLQVDLAVFSGKAVMTFANVSTGLETSAVFKEIVVDMVDDDTGSAVLWNPIVLTRTRTVAYDVVNFNGLPGYTQTIGADTGMGSLMARPSPVKKGIGPGEVLWVLFGTSLPDQAGMPDYLAFFGSGQDTGAYSLGFHAINASTVDGESLSGMNPPDTPETPVPEPATVALLAIGGGAVLFRRRRRKA